MIIEPIVNNVIFNFIKFHLNRLQGFNIKYIIAIIKRRLFIIEWRESHSFEISAISFLSTHHDPHCTPLGGVNWLNNSWNFMHKSDCSCNMIESTNSSDLLPRHWHVFKQLINCMRNVFQRTQVDSFVLFILLGGHVSMILNNLPKDLRRLRLLLSFHVTKLSPFTVLLLL